MENAFSWTQKCGDALSMILDRLWLPDWTAEVLECVEACTFEAAAGQGAFYAVRSGTWQLVLQQSNQAVLLPHGATHSLAPVIDRPDGDANTAIHMPYAFSSGTPKSDLARIVHGSFTMERALCSSFEASLPELIHLSRQAQATPTSLQAIAELVDAEFQNAGVGAQAIVNRLAYALLLEALRIYAGDQFCVPKTEVGWLRAALDPEIGGALTLIHSKPEQPWTVQSLAGQIHMSRSAFAERFRQLVGNSPLQYLTRCRMQKAGRMLRETELGVKEIASLAGYESVTSFSSAFKRQTGTSPAAFRKAEHALR